MSASFDPNPAAKLLADALKSGALLQELPADCRPQDLDDGYALQNRFVELSGETVPGWKLGVGSTNGKKMTGAPRALAARLLGSRMFKDGDTVEMPNGAPIMIEFEIAFTLGRDVAPGDSIANPLDAVASAQVAFELVLSRFVDRKVVGIPSFLGDLVGFSALILGPQIDPAAIADITSSVVVSADGKEMARAASGDDAIYPVQALGELFEHARERGITLRKGELVSTGTLTMPFNTSGAPTTLVGSFAGGSLTVHTTVRG